ncbi:MAG TPA: GNAT family N-acetyltransferase [Polyangiaceae bacterium]|nr:GNAT family N-acetyltransferase [Polyangiaceae bacterium]
MADAATYGRARSEDDLAFIEGCTRLAFGVPADLISPWVRQWPADWRLLRNEAGERVACGMGNALSQHLGGRVLPGVGIAGVAVSPEHRGRGYARALMVGLMREAAGRGDLVALLYASTQSLYRSVGFEQAGYCFKARVPLADLALSVARRPPEGLRVAPLPRGVSDEVRAVHRAFARLSSGPLDRGPYTWGRVESVRGDDRAGYGFYAPGGALEGYVYLAQSSALGPHGAELLVSDLAFATPRAAHALLRYLTTFATIAKEASFACGPTHPILLLLREQSYSIARYENWMMRVLRVEDALRARGYLAASVEPFALEVDDDLLPANRGRWALALRGGRAEVAPLAPGEGAPGGAALRAPAGPLAMLLTGYQSASQLAALGLLEGEGPALERADAFFAGTTPWMSDMF